MKKKDFVNLLCVSALVGASVSITGCVTPIKQDDMAQFVRKWPNPLYNFGAKNSSFQKDNPKLAADFNVATKYCSYGIVEYVPKVVALYKSTIDKSSSDYLFLQQKSFNVQYDMCRNLVEHRFKELKNEATKVQSENSNDIYEITTDDKLIIKTEVDKSSENNEDDGEEFDKTTSKKIVSAQKFSELKQQYDKYAEALQLIKETTIHDNEKLLEIIESFYVNNDATNGSYWVNKYQGINFTKNRRATFILANRFFRNEKLKSMGYKMFVEQIKSLNSHEAIRFLSRPEFVEYRKDKPKLQEQFNQMSL